MEVDISTIAQRELLDIFHYHVSYNPDYALNFQDQIIDFFMKNLVDFPELWVIHNAEEWVRKLVFSDYNIYYKIEKEIINILHIVHGKNSLNADLSEIEL